MQPNDVVSNWKLGEIVSITPVGSGLINTTYKIMATGGVFVMQKIHKIIPDAAAEDMLKVTSFLAERGLLVPTILLTSDGKPFVIDNENNRWRVYPWLEGEVVDAIDDENMAREAGKVVGRMHGLLAGFEYKPMGSIPHFHDTAFILEELKSVMNELPGELRIIAEEIVSTASSLFIDETAQMKQIIHGDLKISNLLFDDNKKAVGVIDFDTILEHFPAVDFGDALRSWCNRTGEDDANAVIDEGLCEAALAGYAAGLARELSADERALYLRATKLIAFELASRFLIDVVRDNYFGFDSVRYSDRRSHNIARAKGQYHLAQSVKLL